MGLRCEVVDLMGPDVVNELMHPSSVCDIPIVQMQVAPGNVFIVVQVINTSAIEGRGPSHHPMHFVALGQQLLCHIGAVLTRDSRYENSARFCHIDSFIRFTLTASEAYSRNWAANNPCESLRDLLAELTTAPRIEVASI